MAEKYWMGHVNRLDDFGFPIDDTFYDGKTTLGAWAIMSPYSWRRHCGQVGQGMAQKYERQEDGRWLKTAG